MQGKGLSTHPLQKQTHCLRLVFQKNHNQSIRLGDPPSQRYYSCESTLWGGGNENVLGQSKNESSSKILGTRNEKFFETRKNFSEVATLHNKKIHM